MKKLDRRDFLKASSMSGIGILSAEKAWSLTTLEPIHDTLKTDYPYRSWEDIYRKEYEHDEVGFAAHCVNCHGNCAFKILSRDGIVVREEQLAKYPQISSDIPDTNPRGCQKGAIHSQAMYEPDRIRYPMKRAGERGEGKWQRISWDQATEEIAVACQLPGPTVLTFEQLFFSVQDRLQARTWVHLTALRPMSCDVTPTEQVAGFVREMGYRGGPVVLEATLRSLGELLREDSASGQSHSEDSLTRRIRRLFLARTAPMSAPLALRMVEFSLNMSDAPLEDFEHVFAPDVQETVDSALNSIAACARETEFAGIVASILEAARAA